MTEDTVLDTRIHEPSMTAGEVEILLFALHRFRARSAYRCGGLDAAGLCKPYPPSAITLVDLHDEYARHVRHADLREAVDGLVGEDPPQRRAAA